MSDILIMGMGYVGLTTAITFAELGWTVTGFDPDMMKLNLLRSGDLPFYEHGMKQLLTKQIAEGSIRFTEQPLQAIQDHSVIFLCVGTPSNSDGSANLSYVQQAALWIGQAMDAYKLVVVKSTVPVGTNENIRKWIVMNQATPVNFDIIMNPEFLREGSALADAMNPDRIVIGSDEEAATATLLKLYAKLSCPVIVTTPQAAIMIKYASNAFLATKISFINELARLCEPLDVSIVDVAQGMGYDPRIGNSFLKAGIGYGGSCFPKDVDALLYAADRNGLTLSIMEQVAKINRSQVVHVLSQWEQRVSSFAAMTVAVLGITFKPNTDDLREAPALTLIPALSAKQAIIRVHDPLAKLPANLLTDQVSQYESLEGALTGADAVILCTEWSDYVKADWSKLKASLNGRLFFDGRNAMDRQLLIRLGFEYYGVSHNGEYPSVTR
ncbi:MAG: UDP-glucose/GDP-mannose dehydrogenase family protein [Candidatus Cohnella colombiensis]|uniref:UDP-glucose 6-dehydrogenase n=1 Tax=Candidatus Cohnella colombiensis TaxID=3121368 RepID=A0AA95EXJ8_9BACL|nr:MAG: UDP-glucose/GDP-mannose dehydrogenase family protein [Cohnella sp.]